MLNIGPTQSPPRRDEQAERRKGRVAELKRQAADADAKLTRLYEAIENGLADLGDSNLKGRIGELKQARDTARADAERAEVRMESGETPITPELLHRFGLEARKKIRTDNGFSRHYVQALVQRIEVGEAEIRITGSRLKLLQTLATGQGGSGVELRASDVRSFNLKWLPGPDSNRRP
ncbi:hypothetical protein MesoLj113c_45190 [Mesorhizobium sp. 113-3-9]|nr:hypothetical protein MesoLj113c_45190 [Mesorhizobium sp. 113-3-9]